MITRVRRGVVIAEIDDLVARWCEGERRGDAAALRCGRQRPTDSRSSSTYMEAELARSTTTTGQRDRAHLGV
jgi:hypothetical protein